MKLNDKIREKIKDSYFDNYQISSELINDGFDIDNSIYVTDYFNNTDDISDTIIDIIEDPYTFMRDRELNILITNENDVLLVLRTLTPDKRIMATSAVLVSYYKYNTGHIPYTEKISVTVYDIILDDDLEYNITNVQCPLSSMINGTVFILDGI